MISPSRSRAAFRFERGIGASLPASGFVVVSRFQVVKERRNAEFRLQEAETHSGCLSNVSWLEPYAWEGSTLLSNCGAVKLYAPVEEGAVLGDAGGALLGCTGSNNVVPLGGHHGNRQALLDGSAAGGVAVQAVGDGGNDLVGAFRGSGKKASGHDTVSVVSGWSSLTPSLLWLGRVLLLGLVPRHNDWVVPGPSKPALCGLCRSYALVRRFTAALVGAGSCCWVVLNSLRYLAMVRFMASISSTQPAQIYL